MSTAALDPSVLPPVRVTNVPGGRLTRLTAWFSDPLQALVDAREIGDVVVSDLGSMVMYQLYRPDHIERVLVRNAANYTKNTRGYRAMRVALGQGLVTSQGDFWKRQRRIAQPAFHRKVIAGMGDTMVDCAEGISDLWAASAAAGTERDVAHDMMEVTLRIACRTFFSVDVHGGEADRIGGATADVVRQFMFHMSFPTARPEILPTPGNWRFWRALKTLDKEVYGMLADRRAMTGEHPHDLMSMFLAAVDEETGEGMTDEQLRDELITMLAAGHETTANALCWTLHLLANNRDQLERVWAELDEVLEGRAPTAADLGKLPFLGRVLQEGMRLYPPAWVHARCAAEDDSFDGVTIPAGAIAILPQWAVHRDPRWWTDPERFDPDRFLPENSEGRPKFAYFPFSGGQRKCIGDRFAQMESILVLATLLQRYDRKPSDRPVIPEPAVTLRPKTGIWQTPIRRR